MAHARVVKNPKGYIDPYKVEVKSSRLGQEWTFHSWHKLKRTATALVKRLNKTYSYH